MGLSVTPLSEHTGAEIRGADDLDGLDDRAFVRVRQALLDHTVIVISGLSPDLSSLLAFGRRFGALVPHILSQYHHPETPEISVISTIADDPRGRTTATPAGAFWHSDLSYDARASDATLLYSVEVPPQGGDTLFANMARAYETLPADIKRRIAGRRALHRYGWNGGAAVVQPTPEQAARHPDVEHRVVRVHPETGRKVLFVNPGFVVRLAGPEAERESDAALLKELFRHALGREFQYRHKWRAGQIVACDNRASMHSATGDYGAERRVLLRMIVGGGLGAP